VEYVKLAEPLNPSILKIAEDQPASAGRVKEGDLGVMKLHDA
jgi:hypothetical protein